MTARALIARVASLDPGAMRLMFALGGTACIGLSVGAEYLFVHWTNALQVSVPPGAAAGVVAQAHAIDHSAVVIAELLGGLIALCFAMTAVELTARQQFISMAAVPVPMVIGLTSAVVLAPWRVASLSAVVVAFGVAGYLRSFGGGRGTTAGFALFMGYFVGFTLGGKVSTGQLGWPFAELGVGMLVSLIVKLVIFRPRPRATVRRLLRSFDARSLDILELAETTAGSGDAAVDRRLNRHLVRHNQDGLMLDAALAQTGSNAPDMLTAHGRIYDVEHAVGEVARSAHLLTRLDLSPAIRDTMRRAVSAVRHEDPAGTQVLTRELYADSIQQFERSLAADDAAGYDRAEAVERFAGAVAYSADVLQVWRSGEPVGGLHRTDLPTFSTPPLVQGWLPGTAILSARASATPGVGPWYTQLRLPTHFRASIQLMFAGSLALVIGDRVAPSHVFWAALTVFLLFLGPLNAAEQVSRSIVRVVGTFAGLAVVIVLENWFGDNDAAAITVVIVGSFVGLYLSQINSGFMVLGLTVVVSQLFVQLHQYSDVFLRDRIEEIGVGAACVTVTVLLVVPLHHNRVVRTALQIYLAAVADLLRIVSLRFADGAHSSDTGNRVAIEVKSSARDADLAYQALLKSIGVASRPLLGRWTPRSRRIAAAAGRSHLDIRRLAGSVRRRRDLDAPSRVALADASNSLAESVQQMIAQLGDGQTRSYTATSLPPGSLREHVHHHGLAAGSLALAARAEVSDVDATLADIALMIGMAVPTSDREEQT